MDTKTLAGLEFVEIIKNFTSEDEDVHLALSELKKWDGFMDVNTVGGTIYNVATITILKDIIYPVLGEDLGSKILGMGFHPMLKSTNERFHARNNRLFHMLRDPNNWWIQENGGLQKVLEHGFKSTISYLREHLGSNPQEWKWGKLNKLVYPHAMAIKPPLGKVFNVGPASMGGDTHTPLQMGSPVDDFGVKEWAPSYRQIVDLSDLSNSEFIVPPGPSGNLASPYYSNLFEKYQKGEYIPMSWTREQVESNSENKLLLQ